MHATVVRETRKDWYAEVSHGSGGVKVGAVTEAEGATVGGWVDSRAPLMRDRVSRAKRTRVGPGFLKSIERRSRCVSLAQKTPCRSVARSHLAPDIGYAYTDTCVRSAGESSDGGISLAIVQPPALKVDVFGTALTVAQLVYSHRWSRYCLTRGIN